MATSTTSPWQAPGSDEPTVSPPGSARRRRVRRWAPPLLCIGVYAVLGAFVYGAHSPVSSTVLPPCACGDLSSQTWLLAWPAYALKLGHNPFFSSYVAYPGGINLMSNTGAVLLGIVFAPFTLTLGPISAMNLVMRLAFVLSAVSMCFVLRRWTRWWPAAFVGGLLYAFSPYMVGQSQSHDSLIFVPLPPLMMALLDEMLVRRRHPVRNGILLGVVVTAQLMISPEVLEMSGLLAVFGLVVVALRHPVATRERLRDLGRGLGAAAATTVVLAGYPLWAYFDGPYHVSGPPHPVSLLSAYYSSTDAVFYPTTLQRLHLGHWLARGQAITQGGNAEYTTYIGIPLLVLLAIILVRFWRVGLVPLFSLVAVVAWIVTLGTRVHYGTVGGDHFWLPYATLKNIPLLDGALDLRYSLIMYLAIAVVLAVGLDRFRRDGILGPVGTRARVRGGQRRREAVCAVVAVIALLPLVPALPYPSTPAPVPAVFTAKTSPVADGDVVLCLPLPVGDIGFNDQALLWAAAGKMRYKLIGFRGAVAGANHKPLRGADLLLPPVQVENLLLWGNYGQPTPPPPADAATFGLIRTFLGRYHVGSVVIVPTAIPAWEAVVSYFTAALHVAPVIFAGTYVFPHVQSDLGAG